MNQEPDKKKKNDPLGMVLLVIVGLFVAVVFLQFLGLLLIDGWSAASNASPAGKVIFFIFLGIVILFMGPWLMEHGYHTIGKLVTVCVVGVAVLTIMAVMPSCNNNHINYSGDLPNYRR